MAVTHLFEKKYGLDSETKKAISRAASKAEHSTDKQQQQQQQQLASVYMHDFSDLTKTLCTGAKVAGTARNCNR